MSPKMRECDRLFFSYKMPNKRFISKGVSTKWIGLYFLYILVLTYIGRLKANFHPVFFYIYDYVC